MKKPTLKEVADYCNNPEQAQLFYLHFESIDWMVGKQGNKHPMANWKSAITGWIKRSKPVSKIDTALANKGTALSDRLWVRMTEIYGHKWTSSFTSTPLKSWVNVIEKLQPQMIAKGLERMVTNSIKTGDDWPPTLIKFIGYCKPQVHGINSQMYKPHVPALTKISNPEVAQSAIEKLKRMVA